MSEMLEKILSNENIEKAYKRICANKGAGRVDGRFYRQVLKRADLSNNLCLL